MKFINNLILTAGVLTGVGLFSGGENKKQEQQIQKDSLQMPDSIKFKEANNYLSLDSKSPTLDDYANRFMDSSWLYADQEIVGLVDVNPDSTFSYVLSKYPTKNDHHKLLIFRSLKYWNEMMIAFSSQYSQFEEVYIKGIKSTNPNAKIDKAKILQNYIRDLGYNSPISSTSLFIPNPYAMGFKLLIPPTNNLPHVKTLFDKENYSITGGDVIKK